MTRIPRQPEHAVIERQTENWNVRTYEDLIAPDRLKTLIPAEDDSVTTTMLARQAISSILQEPGDQSRLIAVTGPCSIHDPDAALEYASHVSEWRERYGDEIEIVMRLFFEKPRTTVGWKGLINDPDLDGSHDVNKGLKIARQLICDITAEGVPVGTELLDPITPQYYAGLLTWGAVGARTAESQLHRELASGLSLTVGFKNGTGGNVQVAVDALTAAKHRQSFFAIDETGRASHVTCEGNPDCHVILRGGSYATNYDSRSIGQALDQLAAAGHPPVVMVDASHGNSLCNDGTKDFRRQPVVVSDIARQIPGGSTAIIGVMIESNLRPGKQNLVPGQPLEYGVSVTDGCVGLEDTDLMLRTLAEAVKKRRSS